MIVGIGSRIKVMKTGLFESKSLIIFLNIVIKI